MWRSTPSVSNEDGAVDLGQRVAQRRQVERVGDAQRRWRCQPVVLGAVQRLVGLVHEGGADAEGAEVVHRELEQRLEHLAVAVLHARAPRVEPGAHQRLVAPVQAVPPVDAEVAADPHDARRVALHGDGAERLGEHDEVALGAGGPVEGGPLVAALEPPDQPAGDAVGVGPGVGLGGRPGRPPVDGELGLGRPRLGIGGRRDEGAVARDPALVDVGAQRVVELGDRQVVPRGRSVEVQPVLGELLDEAGPATGARGRGRGHPRRLRSVGAEA